jgi:hypothetical protein
MDKITSLIQLKISLQYFPFIQKHLLFNKKILFHLNLITPLIKQEFI